MLEALTSFLDPTIMALQPKVGIKNLEFCKMSEASQHGLLGLKSSEDHAMDKQRGIPVLLADLAL